MTPAERRDAYWRRELREALARPSPFLPVVEPVKRMVGGHYGWAVHRFPIKGGISLVATWRESLCDAAGAPSFFDRAELLQPMRLQVR